MTLLFPLGLAALAAGLLPLLIHGQQPESALVIGFGTGITAGAMLRDPGLTRPVVAELLPEVLEAEEYGIAFRKGEQTLADAVSQQLIDMFKDGTLDTIRAKWFANDITLVAQYAN